MPWSASGDSGAVTGGVMTGPVIRFDQSVWANRYGPIGMGQSVWGGYDGQAPGPAEPPRE